MYVNVRGRSVPGHHDMVGHLEQDDLDGVAQPLPAESGLGEVGGEAVQQEPGGSGLLGHGLLHQGHHLVLEISGLVSEIKCPL